MKKSSHFWYKFKDVVSYLLGVLSYALFIFLLLIGFLLLTYFISIKVKQYRGDTSYNKYNFYNVLTGSMEPNIKVYDVVITKNKKINELKIGDVITFVVSDLRFSGKTITHRIIDKYQDEQGEYVIKTKGDANNVADSFNLYQENIIGKVILKLPKLGYVQYLLASKGTFLLVILIPSLAVISYDFVKMLKKLLKK